MALVFQAITKGFKQSGHSIVGVSRNNAFPAFSFIKFIPSLLLWSREYRLLVYFE